MRTADHAVRVEQLLCNRHRLCNEIGQFWFEPQLAFPLIFDENPPIASWHRHCPPQQSGASSSPVQFERINSVSHLTRQTASDVDGRIAKVDFYAGSTHSGSESRRSQTANVARISRRRLSRRRQAPTSRQSQLQAAVGVLKARPRLSSQDDRTSALLRRVTDTEGCTEISQFRLRSLPRLSGISI